MSKALEAANGTILKHDFPYFMTPNDIFDLPITQNELTILTYLFRCSNNAEHCYPSYNTVASKCKMSRRSAINTIGRLIAAGYITKLPTVYQSNSYQLEIHKLTPKVTTKVTTKLQKVTDSVTSAGDAPVASAGDAPPSAGDAPYKEPLINNQSLYKEPAAAAFVTLFNFYKDNYRPLTTIDRTTLTRLGRGYGLEKVLAALKIAVEAGKLDLRYVGGILKSPDRADKLSQKK